MTRPAFEARNELQRGFQAGAGAALATRHIHARVTLLMTSGLILAITTVVTVSIEVVKAAAL